MATFGQRFKERRLINNLTQEELRLDFNKKYHRSFTAAAISLYENDKRMPEIDALQDFASYFGVSVDYLLGLSTDKALDELVPKNGHKVISVSVLGRVPAGIPFEAIEEFIDTEEILIGNNESPQDYFALKVSGDSMAPRIQDGDVVIVKKQPSVENNEVAVVMINGNDATLKRIKRSSHGIALIPDNPAYEMKFYTNEEIESVPISILGKVCELRGKY